MKKYIITLILLCASASWAFVGGGLGCFMAGGGGTSASPPSAPTGHSTVAGDASVTIHPGTSTGATSYKYYYKAGSDPTTSAYDATGTATDGATVGSLTNGTAYHFGYTASNAAGESTLSTIDTATPSGFTPIDELFNNSSLNTTLFGSVVGGSGTVVETTYLRLYCPAAADRSYIYYKTAIDTSQKLKYTVKAYIPTGAAAGLGTMNFWFTNSPGSIPANGNPDTRLAQVSFNAAGDVYAGYFTSGGTWTPTGGAGLTGAGPTLNLVFEVNPGTSQFRATAYTTGGTSLATTGWINFSAARASGGNSLYLIVGDIYDATSTAYGELQVQEFKVEAW